MNTRPIIPIGTCTFGPVILSNSIHEENKYSISIIKYESSRHYNLITCKTTSQRLDTLWPDEVPISNLFGYGPSKIQVSNIVRIPKVKMDRHRHIGTIGDIETLKKFKTGLQVAVKKGYFDAKESLDLAESWVRFFDLS